jgi:serine protease Do
MTGWIAAATTTAVLGAGLGAATGAVEPPQTWSWAQDGGKDKVEKADKWSKDKAGKWTKDKEDEWDQDHDVWVRDFPDLTMSWEGADQAFQIFKGAGSQIGVSIRDLGDDDLKGAKTVTTGIVVEDVEADSPAQKAGFKTGDIVVEFDGERVRSTRQFMRLVQETPADRQVQAVVVRDGQRSTLSVQPRAAGAFSYVRKLNGPAIAVMPKIPPMPPPALSQDFPKRIDELMGGTGRLGITVDGLSSQLAEYFGTKDGVLVTTVNANSSASKAGLKAGDVITTFNGETITSPAELRRQSQRLQDGNEFTLGVTRDRKPLTLKGKIEGRTPRPVGRAIV